MSAPTDVAESTPARIGALPDADVDHQYYLIADGKLYHPPMDPTEEPRDLGRYYRNFTIPKRGSTKRRPICAPIRRLLQMQRWLVRQLAGLGVVGSSNAHAYYRKRDIRTMAMPHVGREWVIRIDLKDFFPSTKPVWVKRALRRQGVPQTILKLITRWCFLDDGLPMGAGSSPFLSNVTTALLLDRRLDGLARKWRRTLPRGPARIERIDYNRYADDLVFSSDYPELPKMIPAILQIISESGFEVNPNKIRTMRRTQRQVICGICVNEKISKPRKYRDDLRKELHRIAADIAYGRCPAGIRRDSHDGEWVFSPVRIDSLRGRVEHVRFVCPNQGAPLRPLLDRVIELCGPEEGWSQETRAWAETRRARREPEYE